MWAMVGTLTVILSGLMMVCIILCCLAIAMDDRETLAVLPLLLRAKAETSRKRSGFRVQAQQS
jgi:hypothetical protein